MKHRFFKNDLLFLRLVVCSTATCIVMASCNKDKSTPQDITPTNFYFDGNVGSNYYHLLYDKWEQHMSSSLEKSNGGDVFFSMQINDHHSIVSSTDSLSLKLKVSILEKLIKVGKIYFTDSFNTVHYYYAFFRDGLARIEKDYINRKERPFEIEITDTNIAEHSSSLKVNGRMKGYVFNVADDSDSALIDAEYKMEALR